MSIGIYKAGLEDLQEILQLQYLSYQSEAALFGSRANSRKRQRITQRCLPARFAGSKTAATRGCASIAAQRSVRFRRRSRRRSKRAICFMT